MHLPHVSPSQLGPWEVLVSSKSPARQHKQARFFPSIIHTCGSGVITFQVLYRWIPSNGTAADWIRAVGDQVRQRGRRCHSADRSSRRAVASLLAAYKHANCIPRSWGIRHAMQRIPATPGVEAKGPAPLPCSPPLLIYSPATMLLVCGVITVTLGGLYSVPSSVPGFALNSGLENAT